MEQSDIYRPIDPPRSLIPSELPSDWRVDVADPELPGPVASPESIVEAALANPLGSPPLEALAGPGDQVCIVFTHPDAACPEHILVPALLHKLEAAGVHSQDITLLCASGPYERTDQAQRTAQLGPEIVERYRILDHDVSQVIHLGQWRNVPQTVNRLTLEADLLIATGVVAPHLFAGYSGGGETVTTGCAGDVTIEGLHNPNFLYNPDVRPGQIRGNPYQEVVQSLAQRAGLRFVLNVILNHKGEIIDAQAGDPFLTHQYLTFSASNLYNRQVPHTYDVVIAGLDQSQAATLYQAVLAALFIGMAKPVVRPGGVIIVPARTPEAMGKEQNAQNFYSALQSARTPEMLISRLFEKAGGLGQARALQLAQLLERYQVIIVGSEFPSIAQACHLQTAVDMQEAVDLTRWLLGDNLDALIVPHALLTLPLPPTKDWQEQTGISLPNLYTC